MTATEKFLKNISFDSNIENLDEVLDFIEDKGIFIETEVISSKTMFGPLHDYSAKVYYIPNGSMEKELITETPECTSLAGALRLSVLYGARYLSEKLRNDK